MRTIDRVFQILLIEDNPTDANLKEALSEHGVRHDALVLDDGEKALTHLQDIGSRPLPDFIILDLNLPKHDGLAILVQYRMNIALGAVPIIVLTSSDSPADRQFGRWPPTV